MSTITRNVSALAAACVMGGAVLLNATPAVVAQEIPEARIAVIDVAGVERDSIAWQSLREQFEALLSGYQTELRDRQSSLEQEGQQLEQQRSILSQDAFQEKKAAFDQRVAELQRTAQERKQALDKAYAAARGQIRDALRQVVLEIAKERDLNLIFSNSPQDSSVIMSRDELSISEEALERLNESIKSVELPDVSSTGN
ncbi:OmpH family outer membrane protein [Marivibrio halodurans]|uniref:OmpH family outer membrane protein n=1 Tax=Marivibrio halodurans TaxID=2039722 RepID=A0A8J7RYI5_9PROT|nr:OmpH family outer membrane protein [Marivibrio halodurans]MBP5855463.1 OmpH family outer membrane protein [Marivibrio halodurans]